MPKERSDLIIKYIPLQQGLRRCGNFNKVPQYKNY